jgi:gliding motility-associated-like protein
LNKPLYILFFALFPLLCYSQTNLVYNGDFELYDTCPINISTPGDLQIETCIGWSSPRKLGTSDYFNVCNNSISSQPAGVPQNLLGFQQPYNGNGYCGLLAWVVSLTDGRSYREYLQTQLAQPLLPGKSYKLSFYVSYYGVNYSIEKIGALFSHHNYNDSSFSPIIAQPQISYNNGAITDSLNWTKVEGQFVAKGGEEFLTLGYFEDSLTVDDTLNPHNEALVNYESYYYVDGIELVEIDQFIANVFSPNDDGYNDLFKIQGLTENDQVSIFNRWGIKVTTFKSSEGWDGRTTSGEFCSEGVYYYVLETKEKNNSKKGFIHLLR